MKEQGTFRYDEITDKNRLVEHLLRDLGPRIILVMQRKLRRLPPDDLPSILDDAAMRVLERQDLEELSLEDLDRLYWVYCRMVAKERVRDLLKPERHGDQSVPAELLESMFAEGQAHLAAPDSASSSPHTRQEQILLDALDSLDELHRRILWEDACSPDETCRSKDLAAALKMSEGRVRCERNRARARLKKAYLRFAAEAGLKVDAQGGLREITDRPGNGVKINPILIFMEMNVSVLLPKTCDDLMTVNFSLFL